ncbi:hypothetical protein LXL04_017396 [Taraxacum kok-saghyz]
MLEQEEKKAKYESEQSLSLERDFDEEEIKKAIWNCGEDKTPGPNGFNMEFIKRMWHIVGTDITSAIKEFGRKACIPRGVNAGFLALNPKKLDAVTVNDFRPISLVGVLYKIIAKILATRIKVVLNHIISPNQSAFVKDRQILDGPLLISEIIAWTKKKKKKYLMFKTDIAKAYDSVDWRYLDKVMRAMNFGFKWRNWIRTCLRSSSLSILVNGSATKEFDMKRGLRQGDPMSPFLFTLVMEGLSLALSKAEDNEAYKAIIGCKPGVLPATFLGIPIGLNMKRITSWNGLVDRIHKKMSNWKMKTLSVGGRLTIVNSILGNLGNYWCSLFPMPKAVAKSIEAKRRDFFWGIKEKSKVIKWVSWDKISKKKKYGGLGVTHIRDSNLTLLAKWPYRFKTENGALWVQVAIGDGKDTKFWIEKWTEAGVLKDLFLRLFALEDNKTCSVRERIDIELEVWPRRRQIRDGRERSEETTMKTLLRSQGGIEDKTDKWIFNGAPKGVFNSAWFRDSIWSFAGENKLPLIWVDTNQKIMDQKTWSWRKRSVHKSVDSDAEFFIKRNEEERLQYEKEAALERTVKNLHEKIASLLCECNSKNTLIAEHAKNAQEAIEGREKALEELGVKTQELESAINQKLEANERLVHLNTALKEYREQLNSLKEEHDRKTVIEPMEELKRANKLLQEKINEANKNLADLTIENAHLSNTLMIKEELIEDVSHQMSQATIEFNDLITRLDSMEKENGILKYEYRVLERELEVQMRCADVASGQQRESMKRAAKMESECQKLRLLVKKQMAGSGLQGLDKRMGVLINRLYEVEEENKILIEIIRKKDNEICILESQNTHSSQSQRSMIGDADMSLMDDFVEMEKLAIVTSDASNLDSIGKELVACDASNLVQVAPCDWLTGIVNTIVEQTRVSERTIDEVLKEVRKSLQCDDSNSNSVSGYITWKSSEPEIGIPIPEVETELEQVKEELENQKLVNEDLDHQISVAKYEINEANQKISALKVELEDRCHCCEELEATCLELQLQLASSSDKDVENVDVKQDAKSVQTGWEITAASAKLAECQETIITIGRQLKALAPPSEPAELTNTVQKSRRHSCLRDHMAVEEGGGDVADPIMSSPKTKEMVSVQIERKAGPVVRVGSCKARVVPGALAIVPSKKRGKGSEILRKLLFRRKKVLTIAEDKMRKFKNRIIVMCKSQLVGDERIEVDAPTSKLPDAALHAQEYPTRVSNDFLGLHSSAQSAEDPDHSSTADSFGPSRVQQQPVSPSRRATSQRQNVSNSFPSTPVIPDLNCSISPSQSCSYSADHRKNRKKANCKTSHKRPQHSLKLKDMLWQSRASHPTSSSTNQELPLPTCSIPPVPDPLDREVQDTVYVGSTLGFALAGFRDKVKELVKENAEINGYQ